MRAFKALISRLENTTILTVTMKVRCLTSWSGERTLLPMIAVCAILPGCVCSSLEYGRPSSHIDQTAEHLTLASLGKSPLQQQRSAAGDRTNSQFKEDPSVPTPFRAKLQDYFKSGYDRGHM